MPVAWQHISVADSIWTTASCRFSVANALHNKSVTKLGIPFVCILRACRFLGTLHRLVNCICILRACRILGTLHGLVNCIFFFSSKLFLSNKSCCCAGILTKTGHGCRLLNNFVFLQLVSFSVNKASGLSRTRATGMLWRKLGGLGGNILGV